MAQKLSVTIALDGADEIERQLKDIGDAGKKAFADIGKEAEKVGGFSKLKPDEVTTKLKQLGITGVESINKIQDAVKSAGRLESLVQGVASVESAFTALAANAVPIIGTIAAGFVKATQMALAWADAVNKASTEAMKLGVGVEQLDKLRQGFERAGISSEAISDGLRKVKAGLDQLDVDRVKRAFEQLKEAAGRGFGGIGSQAMQQLQAAAEGTGKAADDARVALTKLADAQALKSLQTDMENTEQAAERARTALARLGQVPEGTPGRAQELRQLQAAVENTGIAAARARQAFAGFTPQPAPFTGLAAAFQKLGIEGGKLSDVIPQIVAKFRAMPDTAQRTELAIDRLGDKMGPELIAALQTGSAGIDMFTQKWAGLTQAQAVEAAKTQQTLNQLSAEWDRFKAELVAPIATPLLSFLRSELEAIKGHINSTVTEFAKLGEIITIVFSNPSGNTYQELIKIGAAADTLIGKLEQAAGWLGKVFGGGGEPGSVTPIPGNARGGMIGGRGSGTSDSNLAWVSRGEHIMPAGAVRQPGVLAFLEALRRSGGDLSRVLDRMGQFATGGLVGMPALAVGGIGGMSHVTIQFPGLPAISGLRASSNVVDELQRAAAMAQVRSGGRKPSRYT
jgi:hypothetical protein